MNRYLVAFYNRNQIYESTCIRKLLIDMYSSYGVKSQEDLFNKILEKWDDDECELMVRAYNLFVYGVDKIEAIYLINNVLYQSEIAKQMCCKTNEL